MWGDKKDEKKPDEKPNAEQSKEQADALVTQMRAAFEETLKPIREKVDGYDQRFQTIETAIKPKQRPEEKSETPSVFDDEEAAFSVRTKPQNIAIALLHGRIVEEEVKRDMERQGWGAYIPKVQEILDKETGPETKANPNYKQYVQNICTLVVGREAMSKGLRFDNDRQTFYLEDSSKGTVDPAARGRDQRLMDLASDSQLEIVKGNSPEDVRRYVTDKLGIKDVDAFLKSIQ